MSSEKSQSSAALARQTGEYAKRSYDVGFSSLRNQQALLAGAQAEPGYVRDAFAAQRAGLQEGLIGQGQGEVQASLAAGQGALQGGNTQNALSPDVMGAKMAQALYSSRVQEGLGGIEQANKILQMKMGQSVMAGNQAQGAAGNELRNISMLPNYNRTYANVLGAVNAAGAIYGGFNQGGWQQDKWGLGNASTFQTGGNADWSQGGQGYGMGNQRGGLFG